MRETYRLSPPARTPLVRWPPAETLDGWPPPKPDDAERDDDAIRAALDEADECNGESLE